MISYKLFFCLSMIVCQIITLISADCIRNEKIVNPDPSCPDDEKLQEAELSANLHEGDIVLENSDEEGSDRNAVIRESMKWEKSNDGNVYIEYDVSRASSDGKRAIEQAVVDYAAKTCIRFQPRGSAQNYIQVVNENGCFSSIGKTGRGSQKLSLGQGCGHKGVAIHELMHAIGFLHEQSRPDRDSFVTIFLQNVQPRMESQFDKGDTSFVKNILNYDYTSIMHYGKTAFSKNGQNTIEPKQSGASIGQRQGFSEDDIKKINLLYKCDNTVGPVQTPGPGPVTDRPTVRPQPGTPPTPPQPIGCQDRANPQFCLSGLQHRPGFCHRSSPYVRYCQATCGLCGGPPVPPGPPGPQGCQDISVHCAAVFQRRQCRQFGHRCKKTCGLC